MPPQKPVISFDTDAATRTFKRFAALAAMAIAVVVLTSATVMRIDAGHVGIRVKLAGSARGVDDIPVVVGWVFYNPLIEQIVSFPTSVQNVIWTASPHEGRSVDESVTFSSSEGVNVNADIGLSFHIEARLAPQLYLRFRQPDLSMLSDGYVRNAVREAFNDVGSRMVVQDIYGAGKGRLVADVTNKLRDVIAKDGFVIDQLTINGALRLPQNVADAINRAMEATQKAIEAENRVRQVKAEAEQAVAQAHGGAEAVREKAQGDADSILVRARAEAKANEIIRYSTSPAVLQYRALERWDGKLPLMNGGGSLPMLTFDVSRIGGSDADREKKLRELLGETAGEGKPAGEAQPKPVEKKP